MDVCPVAYRFLFHAAAEAEWKAPDFLEEGLGSSAIFQSGRNAVVGCIYVASLFGLGS